MAHLYSVEKNVCFQSTPNDEWLVNGNTIMYRCQDGMYDNDIAWESSSIAEAVAAMLDPRYPRLPQKGIVKQLEGTELGNLINHFQDGKLVFVPIVLFEEWEEKISRLHDKLIDLGEFDGMGVQEENKGFLAWDLYLEIFCQQAPIPDKCWVEIKKCSGGYEIIEVVNRKPQYKSKSTFGKGIQFSKFFEVLE